MNKVNHENSSVLWWRHVQEAWGLILLRISILLPFLLIALFIDRETTVDPVDSLGILAFAVLVTGLVRGTLKFAHERVSAS